VVEVVGVYDVPEAPEPCHLIEIVVPIGADMRDITQADPDLPQSHWQVPWDERVLERSDDMERVAFFFHYLDTRSPLTTPWGEIELPEPTPRPERFSDLEYDPPG
jgi:hypothetical protein